MGCFLLGKSNGRKEVLDLKEKSNEAIIQKLREDLVKMNEANRAKGCLNRSSSDLIRCVNFSSFKYS